MRFEVVSAFTVGLLLPVLETYRRGFGHWVINSTTMFEDYVGGLLLIIGAIGYRKRWGPLFLVVAWASVTSMMSGSFWYQLEDTLRGTAREPNNQLVLTVKFVLWAIAVASVVQSYRGAAALSRLRLPGD